MIYNKLYDWQKAIIDKYKERNSFGIFLDMGIGKTPISLAFAEANKCTKIIIVSIDSKATEDNDINGSFLWWADDMEYDYKYYNKKYSFDGSGPKKYRAKISPESKDILIINYESLFERLKENKKQIKLKENLIDFAKSCAGCNVAILLDESHKIKDLDSKQTKAIYKLKQMIELCCNKCFLYLLTGTPFTNNYLDLYSQLKILGCPINKQQFMDNFCIRANFPSLLPWQQPVIRFKNIDKLYQIIHEYAITMKCEDVCKNLPEKTFIYHKSDLSKAMKLFLKEKLKANDINEELENRKLEERVNGGELNGKTLNPFFRNIDYPEFNWVADTPALFWLRARQLSIGFQGNEEFCKWFDKSRLDEIRRLLEQNEDNYVIFYNFTPEFVELYDICDSLGYKIDVYNGYFKNENYYEEYLGLSDEDKLTDKKRVILANFSSGSTGKNWQGYHNCIITSIPLFDDWQQGLKRIHRTGQAFDCTYHIFSQNNILDESMLKALDEKKQYDEKIFAKDFDKYTKMIDR